MAGRLPERVILGIVAFFGFMNLYMVRHSFSIVSLSMIKPPLIQCHSYNCSSNLKEMNPLDWDERTRAIMLSSFTYGYSLTQVIGGRLAELYGAKIVFGSSIVLPAIFGMMMPKGAEISYWAVAVLRFLQGLVQGMSWPSMQALLAVWIPHHERAKFMGIVFFSASLSIVWVLPLSGYLCDELTWQWTIYIFSCLPLIWGVFWMALIYKTPAEHPTISSEEREYIETCVQERGTSGSKSKSVPWKSIFTSVPFLAIVVCDIGNCISLALFLSQLPNYLKSAFNCSLRMTGLLAGLPFLCRYLGSVFFGLISDHLIKKKILKVSTTRKIFSVFAMIVPATILAFNIGFGMFNLTSFVILCCVYMFFNGSIGSSQLINHTDIAPNYGGTLFGISNTIASFCCFLAILSSGEILNIYKNLSTFTPWRIIYGSCVPLMIFADIFFLIFMTASPLSWNFHQQTEQEDKELSQID